MPVMPFVAVKAARSRLTLVRQSTTVPNTSKIQALIAVIMVPEMHPCDRHEADLTLRMDPRHFVGKLAYRFHRNILWVQKVFSASIEGPTLPRSIINLDRCRINLRLDFAPP